jgi:hypothetical protein
MIPNPVGVGYADVVIDSVDVTVDFVTDEEVDIVVGAVFVVAVVVVGALDIELKLPMPLR